MSKRHYMVISKDDDWNVIIQKMAKTMKELCGISRGGRRKETWRWNGDVIKALREKKENYTIWRKKRDAESRAEYVQSRRNAKRIVVAKAMNDKVTEETLKIEEEKTEHKN